ncbi:NifU family protein [bacterium]|nr:NifU family protein [bacterium]
MNKLDIEKKIKEIILQIRPYINDDGGDIEFIKYEDNYVFVKFYGSCINCMYKDYTIQDSLYETIKSEIPEVKGVISVDL